MFGVLIAHLCRNGELERRTKLGRRIRVGSANIRDDREMISRTCW